MNLFRRKLAIYEPPGMFRILAIRKPWIARGKIWFTQTMGGVHQLHVGRFNPAENVLYVWKTRAVHPRIKLVPSSIRRHARNPVLDEQLYERRLRIPFLQTSASLN